MKATEIERMVGTTVFEPTLKKNKAITAFLGEPFFVRNSIITLG